MAPAQWLRSVFGSIVAFDRSALEYGFALRCTIGVAIPLAVACVLGHPNMAFAPAIGALIGGFTSQQGIYRSRLAVVLAVALGITLSSFLGALVAPWLPALILLTALVGYGYGTISQLGLPAGVAALNTTVAFIIFSSLPLSVREDAVQSGLLFLGGLIQAVLLMIVWPFERSALERNGLAAAYRELAAYARSLGMGESKAPPIAALATARQIVADQQPLARAADVARFKRILAEAEALRQRLGALVTLHIDGDDGSRSLATAVAKQLDALAATLNGTMRQSELETVRLGTIGAFDRFESACGDDRYATAVARDIGVHLRDATQGVAVAATGRPVRLLFSGVPRPSAYVQTKIDWFGRDAIRLAVVLAVAMLIGHTLFSASRGYWIALTAALVLKPDFKGTIVRSIARIIGTVIGAVVAAVAVTASHGDPAWLAATAVLAAAVCYLTIVPNYGIFSLAMTVFVVVILEMLGMSEQTAIANRVLDTLIGGALGVAGYVAFPSWAHRRTRPLLAANVDAQRAFAVALLDAYADPQRGAAANLDALRTACWKIRTEVEASIDAARGEPMRPHTIGVGRALNVLAAIQTFSLSSMALEAGLETMPPVPPMPALAPFRDALDAAARDVSAALLEERAVRHDDALERAYLELAHHDDAAHPTCRFVYEYAGGYVQGIATLRRLAGTEAPE